MPPKRASKRTSKNADAPEDVVMAGNTPEVAVESAPEDSSPAGELKAMLERSAKRTRELFAEDQENISTAPAEEQDRCSQRQRTCHISTSRRRVAMTGPSSTLFNRSVVS